MKAFVLAALLVPLAQSRAGSTVHRDGNLFWIEAESTPVETILHDLAETTPIELWLDEGVSRTKISTKIEGLPLRESIEKLFENADLNYVLYFDPYHAPGVKLYAGGIEDSGRLRREPTASSPAEGGEAESEEPQPSLPPELAELLSRVDSDGATSSIDEDPAALADLLQLLAAEKTKGEARIKRGARRR